MKVIIKVIGEGEDEKGANGLWDLAGEIAVVVACERNGKGCYYAEDWGQEVIYNLLKQYKEN